MGIHDRDYYREDSRGWWDMTSNRGTVALIAITIACFLATLIVRNPAGPSELLLWCDFHYPSILQGQVWRVFTSFFLHPFGIFSLVFGMLALYWFGGEVEVVYGTTRFVLFYVLTGVLANGVKLLLAVVGVEPNQHSVGPAAPLFATLVLFACHYPRHTIKVFFVLPVAAWIVVVVVLALYLGSLINEGARANVVEALVGAAVGILYYRTGGLLFGSFGSRSLRIRGRAEVKQRLPLNLRVYDEPTRVMPGLVSRPVEEPTPVAKAQPSSVGVDELLEAKLDAILEKVARHGRRSLTPEENAVLMQASEVFKKRRR
jgi:membrane associated rhomboid family serine protease